MYHSLLTGRGLFTILILFLVFIGSGCGGSADSFVATGGEGSGAGEGEQEVVGEVLFTLESTLDVTPVSAKDITANTSKLRVQTFDSNGENNSTSEPLEVASKISVRIPANSAQVQIEYLDDSDQINEIWGSRFPLLTSDSEFVVRNPNPDPTVGVVSLVVDGPSSVPDTVPTQFRATATYQDGSTRQVTNSATFFVDGRGRGMANGVLNSRTALRSGARSANITATFGGRTSAAFPTRIVTATPTGAPVFTDSTGEIQVGELILESFGTRAQMRVFSDFVDGVRREVTLAATYRTTLPGVVDVNNLGQVTGFDAGTTTLEALLGSGRSVSGVPAQATISVEKGFLETMYSTFQALPPTVEGLSPIYGLADMNRDGRTDIAGFPLQEGTVDGDGPFPDPDFSRFAIYLGNGDGSFQSPLFVSLPFSSFGEGQLKFFTPRNAATFAAVGNSQDSRLAIVSGPSLSRTRQPLPPQVAVQTLPASPKQLMSLAEDQLLIRGQDEKLYRLTFTGTSLANLSTLPSALTYPTLSAQDLLASQSGFIFHQRVSQGTLEVLSPNGRGGVASLDVLRSISLSSGEASLTDVVVGPLVTTRDRTRTARRQTALVAMPGLRQGRNALLIDNLLAREPSSPVTEVVVATGVQDRFSAMVLESANRRTLSLLASGGVENPESFLPAPPTGVIVPGLHGMPERTTTLNNYPGGTFARFETGDVTGDGTSDIVSWQQGVLTIFRLAAVGAN